MIIFLLGLCPQKHPMKVVATAALALVAFMTFTHAVVAGPHPNMYLNQAEIDAINSKVSGNVEPWSSAYSKVMSAANSALSKSLLSVTFQGKTSNQYYTEKPYCGWPDGCRDGQINPDADRGDYVAAIALGNVVRDLGLAYAFTGEAKYADKAIDFIRAWSLDSRTRMTPTTAAGNRIELFITLPGYLYGADLIWNYGGWDAGEKAAFTGWVKTLGDHAKANGAGLNNFANWRVVLIASAGALLDDSTLLNFAATEWKRLVPLQMSGSGKMGQEVGRTNGLHYSLYAINAMIQGAEILRHRNVNLYDYSNSGKSLELALDYITPYAIDPSRWASTGYQQITTITQKNSMALYELAYSHYQKRSYWDAIIRWKRPMDEIRVMGINTLTHANRFDLSMSPVAPSIIASPDDVTVTEGEDASFNIVSAGSAPLAYQWFRDGTKISGATDASYTLTGANASDNGSVYSCEVSNGLGSAGGSGAVLTVLSDAIAPTLVTALAVKSTSADLVFSEPVSTSSAENVANYQVDPGISVASASLGSDERTVSLTVSPLAVDTTYTVQVSNVQDMAKTPNTIVDDSSQDFTYRTADDFEDGNADDWNSLTTSRWEVVMDEGDMAYYLNTTGFGSPGNGQLGEYSLLPGDHGDFIFTAQAKLGDSVSSNALADYAVVFGYQDPDNYYYVLFNNDQNFTQLFKVINGSRSAALVTAESDWLNDNAYHSIEITRTGSAIRVYFDSNLILSAEDGSLGAGKVGVGSFNDSAYFDDVSVTEATSGGGLPGGDVKVPPSIIAPPNDITVAEGGDASFSIVSTGSDPLTYQWFRDGTKISGATDASYTLVGVSSSDNGSVYSCEVSNSVGSDGSDGAVLTVLSDFMAPTLIEALVVQDTRVDLLFSEPVSASSAENVANYQIEPGITIVSASLGADERTVSLTVSPLTVDVTYTVLVSNVQDVAKTPNTIVADSSQNFTYQATSETDGFEDGNVDDWNSLTASRWEVVMDEGDMAYYLNTTKFGSPGSGRLGEYSLLPGDYGDFTFTAQAKLGDSVANNKFADYAVVFGYQDPDNYYYVLFNNNQSFTQLFKVINGSRSTALATAESDWLNDNAYHSIEVKRTGGAIRVRFDGNLILSADDASLGVGKVGVGSFNDSAYFDDVSVTGTASGSGGGSTGSGSNHVADDFEDGNADDWNSLTLSRWEVVMDEGDMAYYLNTTKFGSQGGNRLGEHSLLSENYSDFTFTAQAKLGDSVANNKFADYAVVFGYQDPDNYYYVLFNNNQSFTQLFKVINGSRSTALATAESDWLNDNAYHSIEIKRTGSAIRVHFDGNLILSADDNSLGAGKVGVGSFNDSAYFDDVNVVGVTITP